MQWLKARAVELGASLCTAGLLIGGLAAGVPFLRARIPETMLYSLCCVAAVILRAGLDVVGQATIRAAQAVRAAPAVRPVPVVIAPLSRYRMGVLR
jgi:hypothetical protein